MFTSYELLYAKILALIGNIFVQAADARDVDWRNRAFETKLTSDLGKRLYALRNKAIAAGMGLLSADKVLEEVKRRRGGVTILPTKVGTPFGANPTAV